MQPPGGVSCFWTASLSKAGANHARVAGVQLFGKSNAPAAIWLEESVANRLRAASGSGESYSDVILRLFEMETR